jgi:hypothetical protein
MPKKVAIWLGDSEADGQTLKASRFRKRVCQRAKERTSASTCLLSQVITAQISDLEDWALEFGDPKYTEDWSSVVALLTAPWWQRLWVIQEVVNATEVIVFCGQTTISWQCVYPVCRILWDISAIRELLQLAPEREVSRQVYNAYLVSSFRMSGRGPRGLTFWLDFGRYCLCQDRHDRVFAIRSLLDASTRNHIRVDYTQTEAEVFA